MSPARLPGFVPEWSLPDGVRALQTECGVGNEPYGGFNLGDHVGDDLVMVNANRQQLALHIGAVPVWLRQVHGVRVVELDQAIGHRIPGADAAMTQHRGVACAIMTADCLPVLVADRQARVVGAAHAGWRGLAAGVIGSLVNALTRIPGVAPGDLSVWLGPAIGPEAFEVGRDVLDAFTALDTANQACFTRHPETRDKYLADLPALARNCLHRQGVEDVTSSGLCTVSLAERFYSFRRQPVTGRMASLIWRV
ncbi:MAG: peptidoglycan editing factor PgeF [Rhodocyclaceae bacterium]|nr:peptidoglycan editing factor PgeF [Rhodocyclaceae bacterium]